MRHLSHSLSLALTCALLLVGCDRLGFEDPAKIAAVKEAEGKAVGAACRHAGRAIEDCYALNAKAPKSAVFAGWKEMNDYMRENKIETVAPQLAGATPKSLKPPGEGEQPETATADDKGKRHSARAAEEAAPQTAGDESKQSKAGANGTAKHG